MEKREILRKMEISMGFGFMSGRQLKYFYIDNTLPETRDPELTELLDKIAKNHFCVETTKKLKNRVEVLLREERRER